jgi:hypothetical protein
MIALSGVFGNAVSRLAQVAGGRNRQLTAVLKR